MSAAMGVRAHEEPSPDEGFDLVPDPAGGCAVMQRGGRMGGLFASREAALAFIRDERRLLATCAAERKRFVAHARAA